MIAAASPGRPGVRRAVGLVIAMSAASVLQAGAAETAGPATRRTFREAFRTFASDGRYLVTFPERADARGFWLTAGVLAATALAMKRDRDIRADGVESDRRALQRVATKMEPLGRLEVEGAALGALDLAGRASKNERVVATAGTAFEACVWTAILTSLAKGAFGRERPGRGSGEGRFFSGDTIFPSGHTARSFAIASVLSARGGRATARIAYPVAALVGLSTVQRDLHWASDVVAGAGLGLAIGRGIAGRHPAAARPAPGLDCSLVPRPGGAALRLRY